MIPALISGSTCLLIILVYYYYKKNDRLDELKIILKRIENKLKAAESIINKIGNILFYILALILKIIPLAWLFFIIVTDDRNLSYALTASCSIAMITIFIFIKIFFPNKPIFNKESK